MFVLSEIKTKNVKRQIILIIETYALAGFEEYATIPVTHPIDICLMRLNHTLYAATLNAEIIAERNVTFFQVFKQIVSFFYCHFCFVHFE